MCLCNMQDDKKARQVTGYIYKENFTSIPDILNTALEISVSFTLNINKIYFLTCI